MFNWLKRKFTNELKKLINIHIDDLNMHNIKRCKNILNMCEIKLKNFDEMIELQEYFTHSEIRLDGVGQRYTFTEKMENPLKRIIKEQVLLKLNELIDEQETKLKTLQTDIDTNIKNKTDEAINKSHQNIMNYIDSDVFLQEIIDRINRKQLYK